MAPRSAEAVDNLNLPNALSLLRLLLAPMLVWAAHQELRGLFLWTLGLALITDLPPWWRA